MKIEVQSKKGLRTSLSIIIDKKTIENKLAERLKELQSEVSLKGFRPGKVPPNVIKSQFGKAVYGEVVDKLLKESSTKAIEQNKIKVAGQPKLDLKTFGEGKDLNYILQVDELPEVKLKSLDAELGDAQLVSPKSVPAIMKKRDAILQHMDDIVKGSVGSSESTGETDTQRRARIGKHMSKEQLIGN